MLLGRFFVSKTSPHEREQLKLRLRELEKEDKIRIVGKILNAEELERRRAIRARFRRRYPKLVKGGILTLTIGPIAAAILWGDADHMVQTLVWWTICVIAIVTYVIVVEYLDYRYQKEEQREAQQAQEEQAQ